MAGEQPRENEMWKMAADIQSAMFADDAKPLTASSSDSGWNVNSGSNRELLYHGASTETPHQSHGGLIYGPSSGWNSMDNTGSGGQGLSHFMDIDVGGFDSSYSSFTQFLQSGLQMDASDYNSLSRSMGIGSDSHFSEYNNSNSNPVSSDDIAQSSRAPFDFASPLIEAGEHMGDAHYVPTTPNSSLSSSSAEGNDEATVASGKEPATTPHTDQTDHADQADQAPAAAADQEESQDNPSADSKKVSKPRKKGQKRNREPRFAFMTKSDVDHLEDGYRWRKYGQKAVKNSPYPRSYYRCTTTKCSVKKRVERSFEDPSVVITTYEGQHTHQSPALLRSSAAQLGGGGGGGGGGGAIPGGGGGSDIHALHSTSAFTQSPFDYQLHQMMVQVPARSNTALFDHIQHQDLQRQQLLQPGAPSPHPGLQRSQSQPQPQPQPAPDQADYGLLQDIFSTGMRKLS